jgi:hypothetical protein
MPFDVEIDVKAFVDKMEFGADQYPYIVARALNDCAKAFQEEERGVISSDFTIRRPWVLQGVKINREDFATKQKLEVRVHIDQDHDFLNKFEEGGTRTPRAGSHSLAVPINVRRTKAQIISKNQRPKSFNFQQGFSSRKSRFTILKGDRRTFLIQRPNGSGLILQRTSKQQMGPHRHRNRNTVTGRGYGHDYNLKILWNLRPSTPVPRTLHFHETAMKSFLSHWPGTFEKWYVEILGGTKGLNSNPYKAGARQGMALPPGLQG